MRRKLYSIIILLYIFDDISMKHCITLISLVVICIIVKLISTSQSGHIKGQIKFN